MFARILSILLLVAIGGIGRSETFTVTTVQWSETTTGSLAWALKMSNSAATPSVINFQIGSGPQVIRANPRTSINRAVTIDGSTQTGFVGKPLITISFGYSITDASGFDIYAPDVHILNLAITGEELNPVVNIEYSDCSLENCWLGVGADSEVTSGKRGVIAGRYFGGVSGTSIKHCLIGGQDVGIQLYGTDSTLIEGCAIGTDFSGTKLFPCDGYGIQVFNSTKTVISPLPGNPGSVIAHCGIDGIGLIESGDTILSGNRIFDCGEMAIDYGLDGPSPNQSQNLNIATGGPQNYPNIEEGIRRHGGNISLNGTFNSVPSKSYVLDFYGSLWNASGLGQAQIFLGSTLVSTSTSGNVSFTASFPDILPAEGNWGIAGMATRQDLSWGSSEMGPIGQYYLLDVKSESDPSADSGWQPSGIDSGPEYTLQPDSPDDVDVDAQNGALQVIVRPATGRTRIAGWANPNLTTIYYPTGTDYRGKFYIYTSNASSAPVNNVPNFRLRLDNEGVLISSVTYGYAATGISATPQEPYYGDLNNPDLENRAGASLRPSSNPNKPSLYRADFLALPVNASLGSNIGASFESYSAEDLANGTLSLTEFSLATYNASSGSKVEMIYLPDQLTSDSISGPGIVMSDNLVPSAGMFNVENDFRPGRRPALDLPGEVPDSLLPEISVLPGLHGILLDTLNTPADKFGIGLFNVLSNDNTKTARLEPGKIYLALFILSSDIPAEPTFPGERTQSGIQLQLQTAGGAVTSRFEMSGPANFAPPGSKGREILDQLLPSSQCVNPFLYPFDFGPNEHGGEYGVILSTPMDPDIRRDDGTIPLAAEPGPGVDMDSLRDITAGINVIQQPEHLRVSEDLTAPWAPPNRARVRLEAILLESFDQIDDGGYAY